MDIRCAIIGPTGYTGLVLIDWLLRHPSAKLTYLASHREQLPDIREVFPALRKRLDDRVARCQPIDAEAIADQADVAFLALPHRAAMAYVPALLDAGVRVIDLSADYRLKSATLYEAVYQTPHNDQANLEQAVYGLPELYRDELPGAMLVANPGCYPTAAALALAPLLQNNLIETERILINANSGVTGAGRKTAEHLHFPEQNEAYLPYGKIGGHRHQPEIGQTLSDVTGRTISPLFVPHLLPVDVGILETIYAVPASDDVTEDELFDAFDMAYGDEPFVRVLRDLPNIKHVRNTNMVDLTVRLAGSEDAPTIIVFVAEDNLVKGASGQAIQNMNVVFEIDETTGLL